MTAAGRNRKLGSSGQPPVANAAKITASSRQIRWINAASSRRTRNRRDRPLRCGAIAKDRYRNGMVGTSSHRSDSVGADRRGGCRGAERRSSGTHHDRFRPPVLISQPNDHIGPGKHLSAVAQQAAQPLFIRGYFAVAHFFSSFAGGGGSSSFGTIPPFLVSCTSNSVCSQVFIAAESLGSPSYLSSSANLLRV